MPENLNRFQLNGIVRREGLRLTRRELTTLRRYLRGGRSRMDAWSKAGLYAVYGRYELG